MKLKELYFVDAADEAVTDELGMVQKEEFSATFQKLYDRTKASIYVNGAYISLTYMTVIIFVVHKCRILVPLFSEIQNKFNIEA